MKTIIGLLFILAGIVVGIYVGVWVCFIGRIVDVIHQIQAPVADAYAVAWGICKIVFASPAGAISAYILMLIGMGFIKADQY